MYACANRLDCTHGYMHTLIDIDWNFVHIIKFYVATILLANYVTGLYCTHGLHTIKENWPRSGRFVCIEFNFTPSLIKTWELTSLASQPPFAPWLMHLTASTVRCLDILKAFPKGPSLAIIFRCFDPNFRPSAVGHYLVTIDEWSEIDQTQASQPDTLFQVQVDLFFAFFHGNRPYAYTLD